MTARDLLTQLRNKGVQLETPNGDRIVVDAPKGVITEELRYALATHKAELLSLLKGEHKATVPKTAKPGLSIPLDGIATQAWMVRAGKGGQTINAFSRGFVAIGWPSVGDLLGAVDRDAIRDLYVRAYPDSKAGQIPGDIAMLFKFRSVMRPGDKVVSYDPRTRKYLVGSIASEYFYDAKEILGYPHLRKAVWEGQVDRASLPDATRKSLGSTLTVFTLDEDVWGSIASALGAPPSRVKQQIPEQRGQHDLYYRQFAEGVRAEAFKMREHYELFYCLEKSIRTLVSEKLQSNYGATWWDNAVPQAIRDNVRKNIQRERDAGVTRRSKQHIDYTTFGELGEIVRANSQAFSDTFSTLKAFTRVMESLNVLRGPIAHCCPLAQDEVDRLQLTVKDWFRLME